jgi:hypothetical protein
MTSLPTSPMDVKNCSLASMTSSIVIYIVHTSTLGNISHNAPEYSMRQKIAT